MTYSEVSVTTLRLLGFTLNVRDHCQPRPRLYWYNGQYEPISLSHAVTDTVPISVWLECRLVIIAKGDFPDL